MASQILPRVCHNLPKLFVRSHVWRLSACTAASQRSLPSSSTQSLQQCRSIHASPAHRMGLVANVKKRLGIKQYRNNRYTLDHSSVRLFICLSEQIDFDLFFKELQLDDTFNSWFRIMELHIWLIMTRLAEEGDDGKRVSSNLIMSLWNDMDKRTRKLGSGISPSKRKEGEEALYSQFRLSVCAYDEGMLSDDMTLAGVLWRTFFQKDIVMAKQLETMVCYVRKQQLYLHNQDASILLGVGLVSLLPLYGDAVDEAKNKELFNSIISKT